mmetsp:Transcript_4332/g.8364  ORF Transcript_4332/g.8364 Transcript_4332/m.8364 type:complete len:125 (+) Transcript_4332:385-759(+)
MLRQLWPEGALVCRIAAKNKVGAEYLALIRLVFVTWSLYPILWAIGDGAATVRWELREMLYVVLDVVTKTSFTVVYLNVAVPAAMPRWMASCFGLCFGALFRDSDVTVRREARAEGHGSSAEDE